MFEEGSLDLFEHCSQFLLQFWWEVRGGQVVNAVYDIGDVFVELIYFEFLADLAHFVISDL